jgi:hypothetical protein
MIRPLAASLALGLAAASTAPAAAAEGPKIVQITRDAASDDCVDAAALEACPGETGLLKILRPRECARAQLHDELGEVDALLNAGDDGVTLYFTRPSTSRTLQPCERLELQEVREAAEDEGGGLGALYTVYTSLAALVEGGQRTATTRALRALRIPILEGPTPARLPAEGGRLELAWIEGTPPFRVSLEDGVEPVLDLRVQERRTTLELPPLASPHAALAVEDSAGEVAHHILLVGTANPPPPELPEAAEAAHEAIERAVGRILKSDGADRLAALAALRRAGARSAAAAALAHALETGEISWTKLETLDF